MVLEPKQGEVFFWAFFEQAGKRGVIPLYGIPRRGQRYLLLPARIYIKKGII